MVVMGITKMSIIELYGQEKFLATRIAEVIELLETRYPFLIRNENGQLHVNCPFYYQNQCYT
jgi:hypothetical protein